MILEDIKYLIEVVHPNFTKGFADTIRNSVKALKPTKTTRLLSNTKTRIPNSQVTIVQRPRYM